jgi:predicted lipoprotein
MKQLTFTAACLAAGLSLSACKIVKTDSGEDRPPAADASGDDARISNLLAETWTPQLIPAINERAIPVADLRAAIASGLEVAGKAHGKAGSGAGAAWNFAVKGQGKVTEANLESRARVLALDTDGDGAGDLTLQLGPVVKGSALRDFSPFYDFSSFRDQIEFAKLGRALNDAAIAGLTVPDGNVQGKTVGFTGVVALKSPTEPWLVTPIAIEVAP